MSALAAHHQDPTRPFYLYAPERVALVGAVLDGLLLHGRGDYVAKYHMRPLRPGPEDWLCRQYRVEGVDAAAEVLVDRGLVPPNTLDPGSSGRRWSASNYERRLEALPPTIGDLVRWASLGADGIRLAEEQGNVLGPGLPVTWAFGRSAASVQWVEDEAPLFDTMHAVAVFTAAERSRVVGHGTPNWGVRVRRYWDRSLRPIHWNAMRGLAALGVTLHAVTTREVVLSPRQV